MRAAPELPRLTVWLLRRLLPRATRDDLLADLAELFEERAEREGAARARRMVRRELRCVFRDVVVRAVGTLIPQLSDVRQGLRFLLSRPGYTFAVVVTLGGGIAIATALFSVIRPVLLEPLPYPQAERLVMIWHDAPPRDMRNVPLGPQDLVDLESSVALETFAGVGATQSLTWNDGAQSERVRVTAVTPAFLTVFGRGVAFGRDFRESDGATGLPGIGGEPAASAAVLLAHDFWNARFAGDPTAVGSIVELAGLRAEIVGVVEPGMQVYAHGVARIDPDTDVWIAARPRTGFANIFPYRVFGRLSGSASVDQLQQELDRIEEDQHARYANYAAAGVEMRGVLLADDLVRDVAPVLWLLFAAVAGVFLIAAANVGTLVTLRILSSQRQYAIQLALGASRALIARRLGVEALLAATMACGVGVVAANWGVVWLVEVAPPGIPRLETVRVDGGVALAALGLAAAGALMAVLLATAHGTRSGVLSLLTGARGAVGSHPRLRRVLVTFEVALCLALLIGSSHMTHRLNELRDVDPGFRSGDAVAFTAPLPRHAYATAELRNGFRTQFRQRLLGLPGVIAAGASSTLPLGGAGALAAYGTEEAMALQQEDQFRTAAALWITAGYLDALEIELVAGREPNAEEYENGRSVAVVDVKMARRSWPGQDAVGKRFFAKHRTGDAEPFEVIGVAAEVRQATLTGDQTELFYAPAPYASPRAMTWVARVEPGTSIALAQLRQLLSEVDPSLAIGQFDRLGRTLERARAPTLFAASLVGAFGIAGLILAMVGLYGLLAEFVDQHRAEIGVRLALGARVGQAVGVVAGSALRSVVLGLLAGIMLSAAAAGPAAAAIPGLGTIGLGSYVSAAVVFLVVAVVSVARPLWRASRIEPRVAMLAP